MVKKYRSKSIVRLCGRGLLLAVSLSALNLRTRADGGLARLRQTAGPFIVTVFAAPNPPRVGPVDVGVLAQDSADGQAVFDGEVFVRLWKEGGMVVVARATREASRDNLFYSALVNLPEAGQWELEVTVKRGKSEAIVFGRLPVEAPRPFLLYYWRSLSLPWVIITLFAMNQWLKRRHANRGRPLM